MEQPRPRDRPEIQGVKRTPRPIDLIVGVLGVLAVCTATAAQEPALPAGLGEEGPALPAGLDGETFDDIAPDLPSGLAGGSDTSEAPAQKADIPGWPFLLTGFWEVRGGLRTQPDSHARDASVGETRLQLDAEKTWPGITAHVVADFLYDPVLDCHTPDLETGEGFADLREVNAAFTPLDNVDLKVGRQILTWGTGDLIFINDLFPKDWNSFFIGRDEEYLKAPSDALKLSLFTDAVNVDVVYAPAFDADRFIDGRQVSYYNANVGRRAGRDAVVQAKRPNVWFSDDEIAYRFYRRFGAIETAAYGYHGFWKSPAGLDPGSGKATFPALNVYGASARGPIGEGIGNVEFGFYDSAADRSGADPFVRNSEWRVLAGYEQEIIADLTLGVQYYVEWMLDHDAYTGSLAPGRVPRDQVRHLLTCRVTYLTMQQNLEWSLFVFVSPSDRDAYLRPKVSYKIDDHWSWEIGGNVFLGADRETFFGQFERNTNVYAALRYSF